MYSSGISGAGLLAIVLATAGCAASAHSSGQPAAQQASPPATAAASPAQPAALSGPACRRALRVVNTVVNQSQINLTTGTMGAQPSPATANAWVTIVNSAAKTVNHLPQTAHNVRLAKDLSRASTDALFLSLDMTGSGNVGADETKLITRLRATNADCHS